MSKMEKLAQTIKYSEWRPDREVKLPEFIKDLPKNSKDLVKALEGRDRSIVERINYLLESPHIKGLTVGGDDDYIEIESDGTLKFNGAAFAVFQKASGSGIKVDPDSPTFTWRDLIGDQFSKNTGSTKPTLATYNGAVKAWQFSDGDEAYMTYHFTHDYVLGTDIHLHTHWSQNNTGATGGTIDFKYSAVYAKAHNQASGSTFTSTPITATFSSIDINDGASGLNQRQQFLTEVVISGDSSTVALFDRDDFEPDGVIELTFEMDANNLTGTPSNPFVHYVDIHYLSRNIGTKQKAPDFYE